MDVNTTSLAACSPMGVMVRSYSQMGSIHTLMGPSNQRLMLSHYSKTNPLFFSYLFSHFIHSLLIFPSHLHSMDFMNVDSFSQLPFKRPPSLINNRDRHGNEQKGIRLFGIQFTEDGDSKTGNADNDNAKDSMENGRKFECHYCCRSFPTSQALGGHQNAHKRERQNAKRAHLHSTTTQNSNNNIFLEAQHQQQQQQQHIYGFPNYRLAGSGGTVMSNGLYGHNNVLFPVATPIHGNPFGLWKVSPTSPAASSRQFYDSRPSRVQEHVSLDLHL